MISPKQCPKCNTAHHKPGIFCSYTCSNSRAWTEQDKLKKSASAKRSTKVLAANRQPHSHRKKVVISSCFRCGQDIIAKVVRKYHKDCWTECSGGLRPGSTKVHRQEYKGFMLDSGAEKQFALLLDSWNVRWIKNSETFFLYRDALGKVRKYYPDFYLPDYDRWIEVKGKIYASKDPFLTMKLAAVPGIVLLYSTEIRHATLKDITGECSLVVKC